MLIFCLILLEFVKMIDLRGFRTSNGLTQEDVAKFLGVATAFISQVESGKRGLPDTQLEKLKKNDRGWNTEMLALHQVIHSGDHIEQKGGKGNIGKIAGESSPELLALRREVELLRAQLEASEKRCEQYWEMIQRLTEAR